MRSRGGGRSGGRSSFGSSSFRFRSYGTYGSYGSYGYAVTYVDCDPQSQTTVEQANLLIKSGNSTNIVNGMYYGSDPTMAYLTPAYGSVYTTPMSYGQVRCKCKTKACKIT